MKKPLILKAFCIIVVLVTNVLVYAQGGRGNGGGTGLGKKDKESKTVNKNQENDNDSREEGKPHNKRLQDLLKKAMETAQTDAAKSIYYHSLLDSTFKSIVKDNRLSKEDLLELRDFRRRSLHDLGGLYYRLGQYENAISAWKECSDMQREDGLKKGLTGPLVNIGLSYTELGDYEKALDCFNQALLIRKQRGKKKGIAMVLSNIGWMYIHQGELETAQSYYQEAIALQKQSGDSLGIAISIAQLGDIMMKSDSLMRAENLYQKAVRILEKNGDYNGEQASILGRLATIKHKRGQHQDAIEMYERALSVHESLNNVLGQSSILINLAEAYYATGNSAKAIQCASRAHQLATDIGTLPQLETSAAGLYKYYKSINNSKAALLSYEDYILYRDSLNRKSNVKAAMRQKFKYSYEKQAAADSIKSAEAAKVKDAQLAAEQAENKQHQLEAKQQEQQKYFLFGGLALALLFGGFVFNRFRVTSKQKGIIEEQKKKVDDAYDELEEKNTEILDSINYAKRIQSAILPPTKVVKEYLPESFVLYRPKDIVAGDFYWMEVLHCSPSLEGFIDDPEPITKDIEEVGNTILFAAADCTGHGVPGAMVSVVCNNGLNRSVREHGLIDPGQILDKTREIVISEFEKSEEEVKDGMDIALCSLQGTTLKYAGAHNPLWIIRKDAQEVEEIKADKQPIGKYDNPVPYSTHTVSLNKGDSFYIFSDGYADQFGGEKGKKLKVKNFKTLLLAMQHESMERQRELIDEAFESWKGTYEQLDDVCVIGVRV